jgi:AcrR family transcriptional regulator
LKKREKILGVAAKLFAVKGFKNTNIAEIARITEAAEGTIFYHFKTKEELFLAILKEFRCLVTDEFSRYENSEDFGNGLKKTEHLVSFYLSLSASMEERFLLLHRHDAYELSEMNLLFKSEMEAIYTCFVDVFEKAIIKGQEDGSITTEIAARKLAMILFALVDSVARLNTYRVYDAGSLYSELLRSCSRILRKDIKNT